MLDIQTIDTALHFLGRADLKGNEVPDFVRTTNALHQERAQLIQRFEQERAAAIQAAAQPQQDPTPE